LNTNKTKKSVCFHLGILASAAVLGLLWDNKISFADAGQFIPPLTITFDQKASTSDDGTVGYQSKVAATYILSENWGGGPEYGGFATPVDLVRARGGVLGLKPGEALPFRMSKKIGSGMAWDNPTQKTYHDDKTYRSSAAEAKLTRSAKGATFIARCVTVDDDGDGLMGNYRELNDAQIKFELSEADLRSCSQTTSVSKSDLGLQCSGTVTATLNAEFDSLTADFTVSGGERGKITLDASPSRGASNFTWSFAAATRGESAAGIKFDPGVVMQGKQITVVLLEPVEVTLAVSNGRKTQKKTKTVDIQKRNWKTTLKHEPEPLPLTGEGTNLVCEGGQLLFGRAYGKNICALCTGKLKDEGAIYHPDGAGTGTGRTWDGTGYQVEEVSAGPFKGTFYLSTYLIKIDRRALVNYNFFSNTPFYKINSGKYRSDLPLFFKGRQDHERIHSDLLQEALQKHDPAKDLEGLFADSHDGLQENADSTLLQGEGDLAGTFTDENEVRARLHKRYGNRKGKMNFYTTDDQDPKHITSFSLNLYNMEF
jgi:hypothetical protein